MSRSKDPDPTYEAAMPSSYPGTAPATPSCSPFPTILCRILFANISLRLYRRLMDERTVVTPDASGLKALGHPVRLRMLGLLRIEGPATATTLAARLGLNTGATSYHLRQLAQHGFIVEDAERGNARDRWWRAAHQSTHTGAATAGSEEAEAHDAYSQALAVFYSEQLHNAVAERTSLPEEWLRTTTMSDWNLKLDAGPGPATHGGALRAHRVGRGGRRRRRRRRRLRDPARHLPASRDDLVTAVLRVSKAARRPLYGWLTADAISLTGTRISMVAIPWFVLTTTGSPTQTGLVAFAEMFPLVLCKVLGGPVDRSARGTARRDHLRPRQLRRGRPGADPARDRRAHVSRSCSPWWRWPAPCAVPATPPRTR